MCDTNKKDAVAKHEDAVAKKGHSLSPNYAQSVQ